MIALIVALTASITINVVFAVGLIVIFIRSKLSEISATNINVKTEVSQPRNVDIYALIDPIDGHVKYVGLSNDVEKRINQHVQQAFTSGAMAKWIQELYEQGLQPRVKIVASSLSLKEARSVERQSIGEYIRNGEKLFNRESVKPVPEMMHRILIERPE